MTTEPFDITQAMQDSHPHFQPTLQSRNERKNMNTAEREDLENLRDAVDAYINGRPVQRRDCMGMWIEVEEPIFSLKYTWRPKPQHKTRDWTAADVPFPCWLRLKSAPENQWLVVNVDDIGIKTGINFGHATWEKLRADAEHSTTRKPDSWHPCEVTEGEG